MASRGKSDRSTAQRQFFDRPQGAQDARLATLDLAGVTGKLLPQPDRRRVHEVRAANLDDLPKLPRLVAQGLLQLLEGGDQVILQRFRRRNVDRRRNHVVAGLPHVDVVVRMHRPFGADGLAGDL